MKLYYTSSVLGVSVSQPENSLGGNKSISVPNGESGNLFPDVSYMGFVDRSRNTVGYIFHNDSEFKLTNLIISITKPNDSLFKYSAGIESATIDSNGVAKISKMTSISQLPYDVELSEIDEDEAIEIEEVVAGGYFGIWLSREFKDLSGVDLNSLDFNMGIEESWSLSIVEAQEQED